MSFSSSISSSLVAKKGYPTMYPLAIFFAVGLFSHVVYSSETTTEPFLMLNATPSNASEHVLLVGKHESLASCTLYVLDADEFRLLPNGSAHLITYNMTVNESSYLLRDDELYFCSSHVTGSGEHPETAESHVMPLLTLIGMAVSMISLLLHLVAFSLVPDLRNLPGWNLAALCLSLLISYLLIAVNIGQDMPGTGDACVAVATMTHFFLLASIIWMTIMSYDVFVSLMRATGSFRSSKTKFNRRKFGVYCSCAYGTSLVFAVFAVLADRLDFVPDQFRPDFEELCWFKRKYSLIVFFAGPVFTLSFVNFILFGLSAYVIHNNKMKQGSDDQSSVLKRRYLMYFRLSVIMGATWIVGIVANIIRAEWVMYLFIVLNTLQGFFIFLAFTCSKKVKKFFRQKLLSVRRSSQQTLTTPTFQSYCFYANSIEKDLDKIVEGSKGKIDTIIIHI